MHKSKSVGAVGTAAGVGGMLRAVVRKRTRTKSRSPDAAGREVHTDDEHHSGADGDDDESGTDKDPLLVELWHVNVVPSTIPGAFGVICSRLQALCCRCIFHGCDTYYLAYLAAIPFTETMPLKSCASSHVLVRISLWQCAQAVCDLHRFLSCIDSCLG